MLRQKKKTPTEFLKLNARVLNTLIRVKYECLQSQKKIFQGFTKTDHQDDSD